MSAVRCGRRQGREAWFAVGGATVVGCDIDGATAADTLGVARSLDARDCNHAAKVRVDACVTALGPARRHV
ncbi:MAG: hypothetical protein QOC63_2171 [Mycobacterium sp.]|jgi:hypothetical protein|nr:hypothetical protein [Mycobacterium sp.]